MWWVVSSYLQQLSSGDDEEKLLLSVLLVALLFQSLQLLQRFGSTESEGTAISTHLSHLIHVHKLVLHGTGAGQVTRCVECGLVNIQLDMYEVCSVISLFKFRLNSHHGKVHSSSHRFPRRSLQEQEPMYMCDTLSLKTIPSVAW